MIQKFVDSFMKAEPEIRASLAAKHPDDYDDLVKRVVETTNLIESTKYTDNVPDLERITIIDHGDYQGTRLYIIAEQGYQPSVYWSIFVDYGSCSGCDAFEAIKDYADDPPSAKQVEDYWKLMLHMIQSMKELNNVDN